VQLLVTDPSNAISSTVHPRKYRRYIDPPMFKYRSELMLSCQRRTAAARWPWQGARCCRAVPIISVFTAARKHRSLHYYAPSSHRDRAATPYPPTPTTATKGCVRRLSLYDSAKAVLSDSPGLTSRTGVPVYRLCPECSSAPSIRVLALRLSKS
jgi:hypothetical protein